MNGALDSRSKGKKEKTLKKITAWLKTWLQSSITLGTWNPDLVVQIQTTFGREMTLDKSLLEAAVSNISYQSYVEHPQGLLGSHLVYFPCDLEEITCPNFGFPNTDRGEMLHWYFETLLCSLSFLGRRPERQYKWQSTCFVLCRQGFNPWQHIWFPKTHQK